MFKLFKVLEFIMSWFAPLGVIYINHIVLEDASWNVDMFGLLVVLGLGIALIKRVDKECAVWKIQKDHKFFRLNWDNGKKVLIAIALSWVLFTVEDDLGKIQLSGLLISLCFVIGWVLTLIGNLKQKKETSQ